MNIFVGRRKELDASIELLKAPSHGAIQEIVGARGIGKSTYLTQLAAEARRCPDVYVFTIDVETDGLVEEFPRDSGADATAELWHTFRISRRIMEKFVAESQSRDFERFRKISTSRRREAGSYVANTTIKTGNLEAHGDINLKVSPDFEAVEKQKIRQRQLDLDESFIEGLAKFTGKRRVLITIDTFELIASNEIGRWIYRISRRMPNTLVVVGNLRSAVAPTWQPAGASRVDLRSFADIEIDDYLKEKLGPDKVLPETVEIVNEFTGGHPGSVVIVTDLMLGMDGLALDPETFRHTLDSLPQEANLRLLQLVERVLDASSDPPQLRDAVDAAALATTVDAPLLGKLLELDERETGKIIEKLEDLGFIRERSEDRYQLPEFIRLPVADQLRKYRTPRWYEIHRGAEDYYFDLMKNTDEWDKLPDEDPYSSYGAWYRYEKPKWQEYKREWLFHSGVRTGRRVITRARLTLVFFEAFWWWGYYAPFEFNELLLEDWRRACAALPRPDIEDRQLYNALTDFLDNYPLNYLKPRDAAWDQLRDDLQQVRRLCGLTGSRAALQATDKEQEDLDRTDALITVFLAHTRRYRDPSDPEAERYYLKAFDAFQKLDDEWNMAWMRFEHADLAVERNDPDYALQRVSESAAIAAELGRRTEEWDHELLANIHRTCADAHWLVGEFEKSGQAYGRAVFHAYAFQGIPPSIDEYTQQFYHEVTTRAAERLGRSFDCQEDRELFCRALFAEAPNGSAGAFPRGPRTEELEDFRGSAFMSEWNNIVVDNYYDPLPGLRDLIDLGKRAQRT